MPHTFYWHQWSQLQLLCLPTHGFPLLKQLFLNHMVKHSFFFSLPWLFLTHITSLISFSMWPWGRETVVPKQTVRDGNRWLTIRSVEASITPRRAGSSTGSCASVGKCRWVLVGPPAGLGSGLSAEKGRCWRVAQVSPSEPPGGSEITNSPCSVQSLWVQSLGSCVSSLVLSFPTYILGR